jgi:opacity protein-like surface antigen
MKRATTLAAAAVLLMATLVSAQAPPNFAGKWSLVPDPNAQAGGGRGGLGQSATIVQDASTLTITRTTPAGEFTSTYKLDGSESKNTLNFNGNAIEQLSKAKWDGAKLIVNTTMNFDGNPVETSMVMSLDAGGNLNIESTRPDFQGGGAPITTKATYKKN